MTDLRPRLLLGAGIFAVAVTLTGPSAAATDDGSIGIQLTEAPLDRQDDPRARQYIIDHVAPGMSFTRTVAVSNDTPKSRLIDVYAGPAVIVDGEFVGLERGEENELSTWTTVAASTVELAPGENRKLEVTITVPPDASRGERYAAVWASSASSGSGDVQMVNRVGIRIYLSVGPGGEPPSDFEIRTLTASRDDAGRPVVAAEVENTGGRALDVAGALHLTEGPGSLNAGPFPAELGTTLAPGDTAPVTTTLAQALPDGPWEARLDLRSGLLERSAEAVLTFPAPGEAAAPVTSSDADARVWWRWALAGLGVVLLLATLVWQLARRRRKGR